MTGQRNLNCWVLVLLTLLGVGRSSPVQGQPGPRRVLAWVTSPSGSEENQLRWPIAVAAKSDTEFAVVDAHGPRLFVFRRTGVAFVPAHVVPLSSSPAGIAYDQGRYVVALRTDGALAAFDGDTMKESRLDLPEGVIPGPIAAIPQGGLLIYDLARRLVIQLNSNGRTVRQTGIGERASALVARSSGGFLASVAEKGVVLHYDANWQLESTWSLPPSQPLPAWPSGMTMNTAGEVFVTDRHAGRILILSPTGQLVGIGSGHGRDPGLLHFPAGISLLPNGQLLVADEGNSRVQLFRRTDRDEGP